MIYFIDDDLRKNELDEIYMQIMSDYYNHRLVSMIFKNDKYYD